jgi:ABC-type bacteriocin/lantibiotic exporter with double-glycine peptidase domain
MDGQAWIVVELVARELGVDLPPELRESVRRAQARERRIADPATSIIEVGGKANIAFFRRPVSRGDLQRIIETSAFPAVLAGLSAERNSVFVITGRDKGRIHAIRVRGDGTQEVFDTEAATFLESARGAVVEGLVPIHVAPWLGKEVREREGDTPLSPLQRAWKLVARERREINLVVLFAMLVGLLSLTLPLAVQGFIGLVQGGLILQPVLLLIAFVIIGTFISGALTIAQMRVVETIQQRIFARVALEFGFKVPRLDFETTLTEYLPETMNRFFEVVNIQKSVAKLLQEATTSILQILFGLVLLTLYHPYFAFFGFALLAIVYTAVRLLGPEGVETGLAESKYKYRTVHWLEEMARALTAFKFSGMSPMPVQRMDEQVSGYLRYRRKHFKVLIRQAWVIIWLKVAVTAGLLIMGTQLVINRQITLGQFVASDLVIITVLVALEKLIFSISTVYDLIVGVEKLGFVSDLPVEATDGLSPPAPLLPGEGFALQAINLRYRYPGAAGEALKGISLSIAAGEKVAIVGPDGAGQSTLLRVLSGLLEDYEGTITYDGLTLRDLDHRALRAQIGQMLSQHDLFDGTIEENVTVGRPWITTADVLTALEQAALNTHVQSLPLGLRTPVAAGGGSLSVSAAKKLLLAQAIAGKPRLLVLEDIMQHLEGEDRTQVIRMLTGEQAPWSLAIVTHDPALLTACDRVYVLGEGEVVMEGPYADLRRQPAMQALVPFAVVAI